MVRHDWTSLLSQIPPRNIIQEIKDRLQESLLHLVGRHLRGYPFRLDIFVEETEIVPHLQIRVYVSPEGHRAFREFGVAQAIDTRSYDAPDLEYLVRYIDRELSRHVHQRDFFQNDIAYDYAYRPPIGRYEPGEPNRGGYLVPPEYAERIYSTIFNTEETDEQKQARKEREEQKRLASQKARELLLDHCNKKQQSDYKKNEWFIVKGKKNVYRIRKASQINVDVLDKKGDVKYKLCTVPDKNNSGLPIEDQLLAQKTLIELNEQQFLDIAIRWEVDSPRTEWSWVGV